ncbi:MAG: hypothetical protein AB7I42_29860 [Bradyrhizobium sp.]|uniref:hypothetical protein n=1 Tax=Bradyrhizobium sp. TaxID=376 RepID=UPI003D0E833E
MSSYRYRTATLVGPWRDSRLKAETDAVAMGQADLSGPAGGFVWKVEGEIEAQAAERQSSQD